MTLSYYYKDPDGNYVELQCDAFGDWRSRASGCARARISREPDRHVRRPRTGRRRAAADASFAEIHARAKAKEFAPGRHLRFRTPTER